VLKERTHSISNEMKLYEYIRQLANKEGTEKPLCVGFQQRIGSRTVADLRSLEISLT